MAALILPPVLHRVTAGLVRRARAGRRYLLWALLAAVVLVPAACWAGRRAWAYSHLRAARQAAERRDFDAARSHWACCLYICPEDADLRLEAARTARRAGAFAEAEEHLDACRRLIPDSRSLALESTLLDAQRGAWSPAEESQLWALVRQNDPDTTLILEAMAGGYLYSYRMNSALDCLQLWLQREPDNVQALVWRGWIRESQEQVSPALEDYRRVVQLDPGDLKTQQRLGDLLFLSGRLQEAVEQFEALCRRRPPPPEALLGLARCRRRLGQGEEARRLLDEFLSDHPRDVVALIERGRLAEEVGQLGEAERWLRRAVEADPANRDAHYALGQCLQQAGRQEEAAKELEEADRINDDLQRLYALRVAVAGKPADPDLRCEAGVICLRHGQVEEGLRWLNGALQFDPHHAASHRALADYYERTGQPEKAAPHRRALESDPPVRATAP